MAQSGGYTAEKNLEANPFPKSAAFLARRVAGGVAKHLPGPLGESSPESDSPQKVLGGFEGRFGLVGNILELEGVKLDRRVDEVARLIAESKMLNAKTLVELRLLAPDSALYGGLVSRGIAKMTKLRHALADNHDITRVVPNSNPIIPTAESDSEVDCEYLWGSIADEFDGLKRQFMPDAPPEHLGEPPNIAMLAIAEEPYARHVFSRQIGFHPEYLKEHMMVLHHVGEEPRETLMVPAPAGLPEGSGIQAPGSN